MEVLEDEGGPLGVALSLLLAAGGAILIWAVTGTAAGVDLAVFGWILLGVGAAGLLLSVVLGGAIVGRDTRTREVAHR